LSSSAIRKIGLLGGQTYVTSKVEKNLLKPST
jgi:hypothetical protein